MDVKHLLESARAHRADALDCTRQRPASKVAGPDAERLPRREARMAAQLIVGAIGLLSLGGCVHVPPSGRATFRLERYFSTPRELRPSVRDAMLKGHVVEGMDAEQVRVVLGDPIRDTRFKRATDVIDVWLFPGYRFHQERMHGSGSNLYRLVLVNGVLVLVEPL